MTNLSKLLLFSILIFLPARSTLAPSPPDKTSYRSGNVEITPLKHGLLRSHYGHEIRMKREGKRIKAKYFASGNVYSKYQSWKKNRDIIMVCAGAFSDYSMPTGLTVDNGVVVNKLLNESMDALVIVYATGGVVVSDLDNRYLNVTMDGFSQQLDLRNSRDLKTFLHWAEDENATVFQTQLLAFKEELQINVYKARTELANRRFLVLAKDYFGSLYHILVNIEDQVYLGPASQDTFDYLTDICRMEVIGMINLDTGMYDILELYDDYGHKIPNPSGPERVSKATNLVTYYYE